MNDACAVLACLRETTKVERVRRRMSQGKVARLLGCSRKRISEFELGQAEPGFAFVIAYAALMDIGFDVRCPDGPLEGA